jgi:hypothetical protein
VVDNWCPLVNFFSDAQVAHQWASDHQVPGEWVTVSDATAVATERWLARLQPADGRPEAS